MKKYLLGLLLNGLLLSCFAQIPSVKNGLSTASPERAGMSSARLARIDTLVQEYLSKQWIGGATAIVVRNGQIVYYRAFGNDVTDGGKHPVQKEDIFRIASQTKAITSTGIMMLMEEGRLRLDDAVSTYIPQFKNPKVIDKYNAADTTYTTVPAKREITIRDLLTHTSGIGYAQIGSPQMNAIYYKAGVVGGIGVGKIVLGDKMKILGGLPLFHQPGERWTYGLNTDLLGYLIEVVSGQPLDQFFARRIFEPLGMQDTYFYLPTAKRQRLATLYTEDGSGKAIPAPATMKLNGEMMTAYPTMDGTYFSGGGGLSSTAYDYAVFMQMLLNGGTYGGKRVLSPASVRLMHTNQLGTVPFNNGNGFGLGFEIIAETNGGKKLAPAGTYSWGGMFSSSYWIDPTEKIVAQFFLNQYPNSHGEIHDKFQTLVYSALE